MARRGELPKKPVEKKAAETATGKKKKKRKQKKKEEKQPSTELTPLGGGLSRLDRYEGRSS